MNLVDSKRNFNMHNALKKRYLKEIKQSGAALILIAFILGLGVAAFMMKSFNAASLQAKQDEKTYNTLKAAKAALIAYAVAHPYSPGQMPWPDRSGDGNYDGSSDCVATPFQYSYLLGQLPSQPDTSPCLDPKSGLVVYLGLSTFPGLSQEFRDAQGNRLWYAVSRNLVHDYETAENPIINPGMVNPNPATGNYDNPPYLRQGGTTAYPWLIVQDRNGNVISNRVAAVIIAAGSPIGGQDHSSLAVADFLDTFKIGSTTYSNRSYAYANQEFVMGEDSRNVSASDITFQKPYYFNDKLVFITADELIAALEQRAANEIKNSLLNYKAGTGYFPYAARLGSNKDYACVTSNVTGVLPIGTTAPANFVCSYSRSGGVTTASCTTGFNNINSIVFRRNNNFTSSTGSCSFSGRDCTCKGVGSCSRAAQTFSCNIVGSCSANFNGTVTFAGGEFTSATAPRCSSSCTDAICSGNGAGTASRVPCSDVTFNTGGPTLPAWIMTNYWYDYFYYANSRTGITLTSGSKTNIDALLIGTGRPLISPNFAVSKGANQLRPSCNLNDHLDSVENSNGNAIFDGTNILRNQNYNDHSYIVAP